MRSRLLLLLLASCAPLALAACGDEASSTDGTPQVVATTTVAGDLVRQVAGDRASVSTILPANADPHDYEPRPSDATDIARADVVVRSGGEVDDWLGDLIANAGGEAAETSLIDHVETRRDGADVDPHWWQNPQNAIAAVEAVRAALVKADPGGAATYDANAEAYTAKLRTLDGRIQECMEAIPVEERKLVTNHDAFGYYGDRYGVDIIGTVIPGLSTQSQASAGEVTDLVRTIERENVKTIFAENTVNPRLERAIADRSGAKVGPALWGDALGPEESTGATYLDMLRFNTTALADGFTGRTGTCDLGE